jgi:hypothetical protein
MTALKIALLCACASRLSAQVVRGVVVDEAGTPLPGVVVQLVDSAARTAARSLTDERGAFRVAASSAGVYRLSTLRIGFRPVTSAAMTLGVGHERNERLVLTGVRVALDTMRVVSQNACRINGDSAGATFAVWEQVRAALDATQLTGRSKNIEATVVGYQRTLEADRRRVRQQQSTVRSAYVTEPWLSLPPDKLRESGYVITERDGSTVYHAPSIDVLLSPRFVEDHCFRLTTDRKHADMLGIAFDPTRERKVPEIKGTLWLDRRTSELRSAEFGFTNIPDIQAEAAGGEMSLARLATGGWVITSWQIRMPALENVIRRAAISEMRVAEIQVAGGELALARRGRDTVWARPPLVVNGVIRDSVSGNAIVGAAVSLKGTTLQGRSGDRGRFEIAGVLPGEYTLEARTPSLDSVGAVFQMALTLIDASKPIEVRTPTAAQITSKLCAANNTSLPGMILGSVAIRGDSVAPANLRLVAEWTEDAFQGITKSSVKRGLQTRTDPRGGFRFCGVPVNTLVQVRAGGGASAGVANARIADGSRITRAELTLEFLPGAGAVFTGAVLTDSSKQPIVGAEVLFPELGRATLTDATGAFRIEGVPAGSQQLTVRRIGYGPVDTRIDFVADQTVDRNVFLRRTVTLDSVRVVATVADRMLRDFEDRRRLGLGKFFLPEDMAKLATRSLASAIETLPGMSILYGSGSNAWAARGRGVSPGGGSVAGDDASLGAKSFKCYTSVWVDGRQEYGGREGEPLFNLSRMPTHDISRMEYYTGPATVPLEYSKNSVCGVLVIWTRR